MIKLGKPFVKDVLTVICLFALSYFFFSREVLLLAVPFAIGGAGMVVFIIYIVIGMFEEDDDDSGVQKIDQRGEASKENRDLR